MFEDNASIENVRVIVSHVVNMIISTAYVCVRRTHSRENIRQQGEIGFMFCSRWEFKRVEVREGYPNVFLHHWLEETRVVYML